MTTKTKNTNGAPNSEFWSQEDEMIEVVSLESREMTIVSLYVTDENGVTIPPEQLSITSGSSSLPFSDPHEDIRAEFTAWESASDEDLLKFDQDQE